MSLLQRISAVECFVVKDSFTSEMVLIIYEAYVLQTVFIHSFATGLINRYDIKMENDIAIKLFWGDRAVFFHMHLTDIISSGNTLTHVSRLILRCLSTDYSSVFLQKNKNQNNDFFSDF